MSASSFRTVLLASSLACIVTTIGIYIIAKYEQWGNRNSVYFMSFAAGVLIAVPFLHIIPKSFTMADEAPLFLLMGFMGLYLFNRFITSFVCHEFENPELSYGLVPLLGMFSLASLQLSVWYCTNFPKGSSPLFCLSAEGSTGEEQVYMLSWLREFQHL
jgi:zinc transporter ZupT